jgi:hypothetical protein
MSLFINQREDSINQREDLGVVQTQDEESANDAAMAKSDLRAG